MLHSVIVGRVARLKSSSLRETSHLKFFLHKQTYFLMGSLLKCFCTGAWKVLVATLLATYAPTILNRLWGFFTLTIIDTYLYHWSKERPVFSYYYFSYATYFCAFYGYTVCYTVCQTTSLSITRSDLRQVCAHLGMQVAQYELMGFHYLLVVIYISFVLVDYI